MFKGLYTALITPFDTDNNISFDVLEPLIENQIDSGVDGLLLAGSTGESATIKAEEQKEFIRRSVEIAKGRIQIIAGAGANSTEEAIELTRSIEDLDVAGLLQVCPYYNKPTQKGLYRHFKAIADNTDKPIILYNIPSRTNINISVETIEKLLELPNIRGLKESSGDMLRLIRLCKLSDRLDVLSGDDVNALASISVGAKGLFSVASNVIPKRMKKFIDSCLENREEAKNQLYDLLDVFSLCMIEQNPIPVKTVHALQNSIRPIFRLPLSELERDNLEILEKNISKFNDF